MPSKTRSQLIFPVDGDNIPKSMARNGGGLTILGEGEGGQGSSRTSADANATSEDKDPFPPAKRPSSPFKDLDGKVLQERAVKRAKRVTGHQRPGESSNTTGHTHASNEQLWPGRPHSPNKPSSTGSMPSPKSDFTTATLTPRAHSVPLVPEIDLTRVPPSPWRSPSKGKEKFRFTSVPSKETLSEVSKATQHDHGGDVQMGESTTSIDVAPPPSSRPSSPMTPLDSSEDFFPPLPLALLSTPTPVNAHPPYEDIQVEVKTYDGEADIPAGPSTLPDKRTPRPKTPSSATRIPRPAAKVQLTLAQAFASTQARAPSKGVKGRMKPKNGPCSNPPSGTNTPDVALSSPDLAAPMEAQPRAPLSTARKAPTFAPRMNAPTPAPKDSFSRAKTSTVPTQRYKTPALAVETVRSKTPVASSSQPKTPVRTSSTIRSKTPVPYVEVPMPKTPRGVASVSTLNTPASSRRRSQSTGPTRLKTPARASTPARSKSVERTPIASRSRSRPTSPITATRSDSPLTDLTNSRSGSPQPEIRGRTRTPRVLSPITVVDSTRIESPSARTDDVLQTAGDFIFESFVAIGGDEDEDVAEPSPDRMDITPKPSQPASNDVSAHANDTSASSVPSEGAERPAMPFRKGKRKASVPPGRREASVPPPSSRVTRSSLLKQKEGETRPDNGKQLAKHETSKAVSGSNATTTNGRAHVARRRAQSVASFAQPTASSTAKVLPPSPTIKRSSTTRSLSRPPASMGSRPSTSMGTYGSSKQSSLSTLSLALEKLNAPTPSRPNTSLGFNRDRPRDSLNSDSDGEETKSDSAMDVDAELQRPSPAATARMRHAASNGANGFTTPLFRRAATVGPSAVSTASSASKSSGGNGFSKDKSSTLMPPPPVPKNRPAVGASMAPVNPPPTTNKAPINVRSGVISGKPRGMFTFGNRTAGQKIFGSSAIPAFTGVTGLVRGSRVVHRASKETSLPMVEGSPVKGGGADVTMDEADEPAGTSETSSGRMERTPSQLNENANPFLGGPPSHLDAPGASSPAVIEDTHITPNAVDGYQRSSNVRKNESRPASTALHFLSQSLSAYPSTPQKQAPATEGKGKGRAVSSTYPSSVADTAPGALGKAGGVGARVSRSKSTRATRATPAAVAAANAAAEASPASIPSTNNTPQSVEGAPKSVRVLKGCTVFVDVKTDEGIDAGSLFIDMLQGMGAKIQNRAGQHCTHIVYKNGLVSTTNRYRALNDPKPLVVGIAWVVECAEKKARVDETKYLINLDHENVAGTKKRRISMIPKLMESPERPTPTGSNRPTNVQSSPPSTDTSANSSFDHLPPLERARRRQSALFSS